MFFIISKILSFLESPLIWVFILLLIALLTKRKKRRKIFLITSLSVFYFFGNWFINDEFMRAWEVNPTPLNEIEQNHYDYAIVLGGFTSYDKKTNLINFHESTDRLLYALMLYKQGVVDKILLSGGSGELVDNNIKESDISAIYLRKIGIDADVIIKEDNSRNTYENALYSSRIITQNNTEPKCLLITSAYHIRRASACFKKLEIHTTPFPVDYYAGPRKYYFGHLFIPTIDSFIHWKILIHEWIGYISYNIMGYI